MTRYIDTGFLMSEVFNKSRRKSKIFKGF